MRTKGFTLLETLVAVAILMIAIGSAFGLAPEGLVGARFAKNQTIATYLAQEALEIAHNVRDNAMFFSPNSTDPFNWLSGLSKCIGALCTANAIDNSFSQCPSSGCPPLVSIETADGGIAYGNGGTFTTDPTAKTTIFTRDITVTKINNPTIGRDDTEANVRVRVRWKEGLVTKETQVSENLFDWWTTSK